MVGMTHYEKPQFNLLRVHNEVVNESKPVTSKYLFENSMMDQKCEKTKQVLTFILSGTVIKL